MIVLLMGDKRHHMQTAFTTFQQHATLTYCMFMCVTCSFDCFNPCFHAVYTKCMSHATSCWLAAGIVCMSFTAHWTSHILLRFIPFSSSQWRPSLEAKAMADNRSFMSRVIVVPLLAPGAHVISADSGHAGLLSCRGGKWAPQCPIHLVERALCISVRLQRCDNLPCPFSHLIRACRYAELSAAIVINVWWPQRFLRRFLTMAQSVPHPGCWTSLVRDQPA